jgi:sugar lactone lactonase YvrE
MKRFSGTRLTAVAALACAAIAQADGGPNKGSTVYTLTPSTHGNPEGIAFDNDTQTFFVGATGDGTIYRGTLGNPNVEEFIPGAAGKQAGGLKTFGGKLYVAGAFAGTVSIYDIASKSLVASFQNFGAGMLNDLVVTASGDVFLTDSFVPTLWRITAAQVAAGGGAPAGIPLDPEIEYQFSPDPFNLNGIVALKGGQSLIVIQSNTGKLFRIDFDPSAAYGRTIHPIAAEPLLFGDGLLIDGSDLVVVQNGPPGSLTVARLNGRADRADVIERRTDPSLRFPSTVARARGVYLVVNADFIDNAPPFTVTSVWRRHDEE